jgi:hypothetical protein
MATPFARVIIRTPGVELTVDQEGLKVLAYRISREANSGKLKRDLVAGLRAALAPAAQDARESILAMASQGRWRESGGSLRAAIAAKITTQVRFTGSAVGASVRARKTGMPRKFNLAPKRTNSPKGWRRRVFGGVWIVQMGKPNWFDDPMRAGRERYRAACLLALEKMSLRLKGL